MLETLHIRDYALINEIEIGFGPGFNVLTGETGAGKSIIIGALNLVLGARASGEVVRDGARQARVDAVFRIPQPSRHLSQLLSDCEVATENAELVLSRVVTSDGRSRGHAGGSPVPISVLARIGDELVDLHGQHEHQSLLKPDRQLDLLDAFAGAEDAAAAMAATVRALRSLDKSIAELESEDRERVRRVEFLRFEVSEIDAAGLSVEEEEELKARRNLITHAEKIVALAQHAYRALYEGEGAASIDSVDSALQDLEELAAISPGLRPLVDQLAGIRAGIEDVAGEVRSLAGKVEFDPQELETLNQRIALIGRLKRKYGETVSAVLSYRDQALEEIRRFEERDRNLERLQSERRELLQQAETAAQALSRTRKEAARRLDKKVTVALQELGMKGGRFETHFETTAFSFNGIDHVEFYLTANPGEKLKPLRQVASGGEVSRVMLAVKSVFADADKIPTLVFDEIDAGVGGVVAGRVAAKLAELSACHQTICITHIPQIAAAATSHYHVAKTAQKGRSVTTVVPIAGRARAEEIARLLDGSVSELSLKHAMALLKTNA